MSCLGLYSPAKSSERQQGVVLLIFAWSFYNIMSNMSLSQNSVGIYQMMKLLMAPGAVLWDALVYKKRPSLYQALLLLCAVLGISVCTASGLDQGDLHLQGLAIALVSVLLAIFQKGLTSHVTQHSSDTLSPLQLLEQCMPWMSSITILGVLCLEDVAQAVNQLLEQPVQLSSVVLMSSAASTLANISATWVLTLSSPLAHVLLGQLKTVCILHLEPNPFTAVYCSTHLLLMEHW